ncbi:hypothetical protein [Myxococcus sp. AS-1-15]|uniref:hypothetical protein n=1 Tax=Myxococcus sp. AS-1-15 TaxID=2874600 RepID=UPI001CBCE660|nr:hypothetical protein [Myxococcus sp. AS-1-15]MBZ4395137.1 hypothetical protein [Myxococcus sp. AS-1-15]
MSPRMKRYTRKDLRLEWRPLDWDPEGASRCAACGPRHTLYVDPPARRSDLWRWGLHDGASSQGGRGWLITSGFMAETGTLLQAQGMAEEAVRTLAEGLLAALKGGAR